MWLRLRVQSNFSFSVISVKIRVYGLQLVFKYYGSDYNITLKWYPLEPRPRPGFTASTRSTPAHFQSTYDYELYVNL